MQTAEEMYFAEKENERLLTKLEAIVGAIMDADPTEFQYTRRTPTWMEGFTCGKMAAAAAAEKVIKD